MCKSRPQIYHRMGISGMRLYLAGMNRVALFILATVIFFSCQNGQSSPAARVSMEPASVNGKALFEAQCASCHKPDVDMTGPALKGALSRWPDKQTLYDFIRNPTNVIQRDKYALALYEKWNRTNMLPFPHLTDAEIDAILLYCDNYVRP